MSYCAAQSLSEALAALAVPGAEVIAGGTDWFPARGGDARAPVLVDVTQVAGLRGITRDGAGWRIGAAVTWAELARADLPGCFAGLQAAARQVGAVQVQNAGTIGGNLCNASPAADGVPPLLVLGAAVEVVSRAGVRVVPLERFVLGPRRVALAPGELVSAVLVPAWPGWNGGFDKAGARAFLVISVAMVAGLFRVEGGRIAAARVAVGACGPVAVRLPGLEAALVGHPVGQAFPVARAHLAGLAPIDDIRASADYRRAAVATMLARLIGGLA